jgi:hypothetical protein
MGRMSPKRISERAEWLKQLMGERKVIARHEVVTAYRDAFRIPYIGKNSLTKIKQKAGLISWDYTRGDMAVKRASGSNMTVWADPTVLMMSRAWRQAAIDALPSPPPTSARRKQITEVKESERLRKEQGRSQ